MSVLTFERAMRLIDGAKNKHLLLGNGFSISLKLDIFSYGTLFENADFSVAPHVPALFEALGTKGSEFVINYLQNAAKVVDVYRPKLRPLAASRRGCRCH